MNWLKTEYAAALRFLKVRIWWLLSLAVLFFMVTAIFWAAFRSISQESMMTLTEAVMNALASEGVLDASGGKQAVLIIFHNIRAMALGVLLGVIPFLFLPVITLLINAAAIGMIGAFAQRAGMGFGMFLLGILPHGIFEFPALFISFGLGIFLCLNFSRTVIHSPKAEPMMDVFLDALRTFILVGVPLAAVAGLIEAFVTPWFLGM